jgi:hypothetical protein
MSDAQIRLAPTRDTDAGTRETVATHEPLGPTPAPARAAHWTVEFRGGLGLATNPTGGTGQLPAPGPAFLPGNSAFGPARAASSWLFGDGAAQLNALVAPSMIAPQLPTLDAVLTSRSASRSAGGTLGFTIGRDLSARLGIDLNVDVDLQPFGMTNAATGAIEATRAGFVSTWQTLIGAFPPAEMAVTATKTGAAGAGRHVEASGMLTYHWKPAARLGPFLTVGAGMLTNTGSTATTALTGTYQFTLVDAPSVPFHQTDMVTIHASDMGSRLVGILGGGIDKALSAHSGLRFAARLAIGSSHVETTLDASPVTQSSSPAGDAFFANHATTIIISNGPGIQSTLSGPSLTGFKTFIGKGTRIESTMTVGFFIRF